MQVADVAATALLWASDGGGDGRVGDGWFAELPDHREAVHQATGMLVAEFAIPAEPALARLRAYAFAEGRLIDDVASDLVARRLRPADIDT